MRDFFSVLFGLANAISTCVSDGPIVASTKANNNVYSWTRTRHRAQMSHDVSLHQDLCSVNSNNYRSHSAKDVRSSVPEDPEMQLDSRMSCIASSTPASAVATASSKMMCMTEALSRVRSRSDDPSSSLSSSSYLLSSWSFISLQSTSGQQRISNHGQTLGCGM